MLRLVVTALIGALALSRPALAEQSAPPSVERVLLETSRAEARAPGLVRVTLRLEDDEGEPIAPRRLPSSWSVVLTRDGAPLGVSLEPVSRSLVGELSLRRSGVYRLRAQVARHGEVVAESDQVILRATAEIDFDTVRAGETVCRPLPGGGRGLVGEVLEGELPRGLRLWGACLVADDSVEPAAGTILAAVHVKAGREVERRLYDMSYQLEPRLLTPRRVFFGFTFAIIGAMFAVVAMAVRRRRPGFGPTTALALAAVDHSPYRGDRVEPWQVLDLELYGAGGAVDLGRLLSGAALAPGELLVRPTDDGLVEFVGPRREELRAKVPDRPDQTSLHRIAVPYGSKVVFRDLLFAPLVGDQAAAAVDGATEFLDEAS